MNFLDKHKALIITVLLTGTIVMAMFSVHITKKAEQIAESFYEMIPETEEEKEKRLMEELASKLPQTNSAFDEDQEFKDLMKNFKSINSNDFEKTTKAIEESKILSEQNEVIESSAQSRMSGDYALNKEERSSFNKVKDMLALHSPQAASNKSSNANSTLTYSLKGRKLLEYNTPRYLCETNGKIVVNITVDQQGTVTNAYINTTSTSNNECLVDHALEYAKAVVFDASGNPSQVGSITFYFKGKN